MTPDKVNEDGTGVDNFALIGLLVTVMVIVISGIIAVILVFR